MGDANPKEMLEMEIGTVVSTPEGPSPTKFAFVVNEKAGKMPVKKNQFIVVESPQGKMVAMVQDIKKTNRYFERAESVREYERSGTPMLSIFPVDRWEYLVAEAQPLGVYNEDGLHRASFPPSPGTKVYEIGNDLLKKFLGFSDAGLEIGKVENHDLPVKLDLTRLVQKHLALLGISGCGKSFLANVLLEELLDRPKEAGRIAIFIIDVHGEYIGFAKTPDYEKKTKVVNGQEIRIGVKNLSARQIAAFVPKITSAQIRELDRIIKNLKKETEGKPYNLKELIKAVKDDPEIKESVAYPLTSWLSSLSNLRLFNYSDYPSSKDLKPGKLMILDLSSITSLNKKQIIVAYFSQKLFELRKKGLIPPYLEVLEEAHQFAPEGVKMEASLSAPILRTIAREGRKFYASLCLISQRPIQLSTTVLSQANTHIVMRVTNPYDLDHIGKSSEGITRETLNTISSLKVGEGLIVGSAVNFPVFVKIRKRKSKDPDHAAKLQDYAIKYEGLMEKEEKDAEAFM